jgi:hypothetical protein
MVRIFGVIVKVFRLKSNKQISAVHIGVHTKRHFNYFKDFQKNLCNTVIRVFRQKERIRIYNADKKVLGLAQNNILLLLFLRMNIETVHSVIPKIALKN